MGHLDLNSQLDEYYSKRPSLPIDKDFTGHRDPKTPWLQPTSAASIYLLPATPDSANTNRLRLAALPGVKVATIAQGSLGGSIPLQGWGQLGAYEDNEFYQEVHFMNMRRLYNEAKGKKTPGRPNTRAIKQ